MIVGFNVNPLNQIYEGITLYIPIFDIYSYKNNNEEYIVHQKIINYNFDNIGLRVQNTYQSPKSIIRIEKIEIKNEIKNYLENDVPNYLVENNLFKIALYGEIIRGNGFNQKKIDNIMGIYHNHIYLLIRDLSIDINGKNIEINGIMISGDYSFYKSNEHIFTLTESFLSKKRTRTKKITKRRKK